MQQHPESSTPDDDEVRKKADDFARRAYTDVWQRVKKSYHRSPEDDDEDMEQPRE